MDALLTPRLRLVPLTRDELSALGATEVPRLRIAGAAIVPQLVDPPVVRAIRAKMEGMEHAPTKEHPWLTYWLIVLRSEERGIGLVGLKGAPNDDGEVEIGYGIAPEYRCRGMATEAASGLIGWAFSDPRCWAVSAIGVRDDNVASKRVLEKLGMRSVRRDDRRSDWRVAAGGRLTRRRRRQA